MRIGTKGEKYCRSLSWLIKKGGLIELEKQLKTKKDKGLNDPFHSEDDYSLSVDSKISKRIGSFIQKFGDENEPEYVKQQRK